MHVYLKELERQTDEKETEEKKILCLCVCVFGSKSVC